ncbi:hypothetical protein SAMN05421813_103183 [Daejeonella rubra]|uniref:Uncharacterized protein n=1 Tax=Daejeonella rubra TaxID=990371 RepID=A0A1G9NUH8_9SPHI|nr:hypothetical protein [Daejeonella rubra]SDL90049.1 hypothetical protein SAMN05421813_103183 [Daejeonella rubra]
MKKVNDLLKISACVILLFSSCEKDEIQKEIPREGLSNTPVEFRSWFNKRFINNQINIRGLSNTIDSTKSLSSMPKLLLEPVWDEAKNYTRGDSTIAEIPLKNGNIAFSKNQIDAKAFDFSKTGNVTSLLFIQTDSKVRGVLMTIIGDEAYLQGDIKKLKNNTFIKKEKDFSGDVLYHSSKGIFINGYRYYDGIVVGYISSGKASNSNEKKKYANAAVKELICDTYKQVTTYRQCDGGCVYWTETIFFQYCYIGDGLSDQGPVGCGGDGTKDLMQAVDGINCVEEDPIEDIEPTLKELAYKIYIHKLIMRNAAAKLGICPSAIELLEQGVVWTDINTAFGMIGGTSIYHFDALSDYYNIQQNWSLMTSNLNKQQSISNYQALGYYIHAFQDFYAHSNYGALLIRYYGNDKNNIPFSEVLNDTSGKYDGLKEFLKKNELKTGTFDLITHTLSGLGIPNPFVNYEETHSAIADDEVETFAGKYAARLAEQETSKILQWVNKCN